MQRRMSRVPSDADPCLRRVLVAMMISDTDIDAEEVATVRRIYTELTGGSLSADELKAEVAAALRDGLDVAGVVAQTGAALDLDTRQRILSAAFEVASADGFVVEEEEAALEAVASALGLDAEQSRTTLSGLIS